MTDQLILGGVVFQPSDYSSPQRMPFGGAQAMIVHKLPGGSRVIDTLGPDEDDISWVGFFHCDNALQQCQKLDAMRAAGKVITLTYAGMSRQVIIRHFKPNIRRYPHLIDYEIACTVSANPSFGIVTPISGVTSGIGAAAGATVAGAAGALAGPAASSAASIDALISSDLSTASTASAQ